MFTTLGITRSMASTVASRRTSASAPRSGAAGNAPVNSAASAMRMLPRRFNLLVFLIVVTVITTNRRSVRSIKWHPSLFVGAATGVGRRQYLASAPATFAARSVLDFANACLEKQWQGVRHSAQSL